MVALRLVLLLMLSMALEVVGPIGPDVMGSLEGSQEAARTSAHPRLRLDRDVHARAKSDPVRITATSRPSGVAAHRRHRPLTGGWVRKLPPAASDSASLPEDH
jgi:hypothetical protein